MARHEQDREDIMQEATALVERAEFQLDGYAQPVVIGFRRDGSASFFFGPDHVFQFNSARQLRRGYIEGQLLKAENGKLVCLVRQRKQDAVILHRRDLSVQETGATLCMIREHLDLVAQQLRDETASLLREVPPASSAARRIGDWLADCGGQIEVARRPHV